jgi:uncharacterized membrane protein
MNKKNKKNKMNKVVILLTFLVVLLFILTIYQYMAWRYGYDDFNKLDIEKIVEKYSRHMDLSSVMITISSCVVFLILLVFVYYLFNLSNYIVNFVNTNAFNLVKFTAEVASTIFVAFLLVIGTLLLMNFIYQYYEAFSQKQRYNEKSIKI